MPWLMLAVVAVSILVAVWWSSGGKTGGQTREDATIRRRLRMYGEHTRITATGSVAVDPSVFASPEAIAQAKRVQEACIKYPAST